ncbi:histidinol-phosphate transaminase [Candidatus Nitrosotalea okcheonensis]|uniref:Putative aminotransferase class I and II n=1 Tax=Candidatus Nitrosotalea okcheonensis TaxID=1903276 RepID=A0A2H1FGM2_9ARCH|nr:histidinol-phosphate transaminase [Candidatus Nitrosotalea okcheonensis]SMH71916.1 putative aminotransferase class I and II [Candidatus Nitrosotalea okcheonensis]
MRIRVEKAIANHKVAAHGGMFSNGLKHSLRLLDFSSNVNPLGFPPKVKNVFKNTSHVSIYPDPNSNNLRIHLQKYTGVPTNQIIVGNGATEIIYNFCATFLRNQKVLIPIPTFSEYESAAKLNGAILYFFKTMNLNKNLSKFQDAISKKNCVFICNPNNPTGVLMKKKNMLKIVESAYDKSAMVFLDECFIELVPDGNESVISHMKEFDNLFILRSLTKSFGLAGLRIGYGLGNKKIIEILQKIKIPWNISGIAQQSSINALSDRSHLPKTLNIIRKESKFLIDSISKIRGFTCYNSDTNFILIKSKTKSKQIQNRLLKKNILIRDCSTFRGLNDDFIRIAVRTHKENLHLIEALRES